MPTTRMEYVDQPFAGRRHTPDTARMQALYLRLGEDLAQIGLRKGDITARGLQALGQMFTNYTGQKRERADALAAAAAARELRERERREDRAFEREQQLSARMERENERLAERARADESENRSALRWAVDNTEPGPVNPVLAQMAAKYPELAGRFTTQETLPATVTPGAMGEVSPVREVFSYLHPNAAQTERAREREANRQAQEAARAERVAAQRVDDARQALALKQQKEYQDRSLAIQQQQANTAAQNAQARLGGGAGTLTPAYRNALERVIGNLPANRRGPKVTHAERLLAEQNEPELKDFIRQTAIDTENVDTKNQVLGRMATIASLNDTLAILRELKAKGVPTNILTGTLEDVARKLGTSTNTEYVELANRLQGTLINYRRAATGVAFGEREGQAYEKMFPNYRNTLPVNEALISGLMREMTTYDRVYWEHKLGKDGAELILGPQAGQPAPAAGGPDRIDQLIEKYGRQP